MKLKVIVLLFLVMPWWPVYAKMSIIFRADCANKNGIHISIKNTGNQDFYIKKSQLPWLPYSSNINFSIYATDGKGGFITLDRLYPVWDVFVDSKTLVGREKDISGFISYNLLIYDFSKIIRNSDILIRFKTKGNIFYPSSGTILIPRKTSFLLPEKCPSILMDDNKDISSDI